MASGSIALTGLAFLGTTIDVSATMKIVCLTIGAGLGQLIFLFGPLMIGEVTPSRQRGAWLAINNSVATLAGLIAPVLMGRFVGAAHSRAIGFEHGFLILGSILLAASVAAFWLIDPEKSMRRLRGLTATNLTTDPQTIHLTACGRDEPAGAS